MAGDWIKMRSDLFTHPKVVRISSALKADTLRTVGGLMSVWCLFDAHSADGCLEGYTPEVLDAHLRWDGFASEMQAVGWLLFDPDTGLSLPEFDTHNGKSAKRRALDSERKREDRKTSASDADKTRTREEKRREEVSLKAPTVLVGSPAGDTDAKPAQVVDLKSHRIPCPAVELVEVFHAECQTLPRVMSLNDTRRKHLTARWREVDADSKFKDQADGVELFRAFFQRVNASDFLSGRNGKWQSCNFDWLFLPTNFLKVWEGNYDNDRRAAK